MNPILAMLFGGQTRTERKDLTKAKDFPPFLLNATKKLAKAIGKVSPILGAMLDMEAGFMLLDGSATANGAKRCRSFSQEQHRIVNSNGDTLVGTLYKADVLVPTVNVDRVYGACAAEKDLIRYPDAHHCQSEYFYHEEYFEKIERFHKRYL